MRSNNERPRRYSHRVDGPDDESESSDGGKEFANLATLGHGGGTTVNGKHPDNNEVGNASNSVPAPLLRGTLAAEGGEQTGEDHDDIGDDSHEDVATADTSQKAEIEKEERGSDAPVNVAGPVDLAVDVLGGVRNVLVCLTDGGVVVADTVTSSHGKVGERGEDDNHGGDNMIQTLLNWDSPCHTSEDNAGNEHDDENNPE